MQPGVEGVQHGPRARDAEVRFEVLVGVPAERADPVARLEPEFIQGYGELLRAGDEVREGVAVEGLVGAAGDYFAVTVELLRPPQDVGKRELEVLGKSL